MGRRGSSSLINEFFVWCNGRTNMSVESVQALKVKKLTSRGRWRRVHLSTWRTRNSHKSSHGTLRAQNLDRDSRKMLFDTPASNTRFTLCVWDSAERNFALMNLRRLVFTGPPRLRKTLEIKIGQKRKAFSYACLKLRMIY